MKLICNKQSLYEAVINVSKAASDKSSIPALEGIKMKLQNNILELTGYDLEIGIRTEISVKSEDIGEFIVNSRLLSDIIKRMPTEDVLIEVNSSMQVKISGGATEYTVSAMTADEYPELPEADSEEKFAISQGTLKDMIRQTIFAVAVVDTKPILKGELFEIQDGVFNMVSLDGYRLAVRTENINTANDYKFVVPSNALREVIKLLNEEEDENCIIYISKKHIIFDISGYLVYSRLIEGEFHNYKGSIPKTCNTEVIVNTKDMIDCLERASLLINERVKSPVRCIFDNGQLNLSCSTSIGKISDEISVDITGPMIEIGFNCKFLLDPLKTITDDKVKLQMNGGNLPMKIVPLNSDNYTFLVLPVRLKGE